MTTTFDPSRVSGLAPGIELRPKDQTYTNLADALQAANTDAGDELIVQTDDGQYVVCDVVRNSQGGAQAAAFDPSGLQFGSDAHVQSAVFTNEVASHTPGVGPLNYVRTVPVTSGAQAPDLDRTIDSTVALAQATFAAPEGQSGPAVGFRHTQSNSVISTQIRSNLMHVLGTIDSTLHRIDSQIEGLRSQEVEARQHGDTAGADRLAAQRATLTARREDLHTYQLIVGAEVMTDTAGGVRGAEQQVPNLPGMTGPNNLPLRAGAWRGQTTAVDQLRDRLTALTAALQETTDPARRQSIQTQITAVQGAITHQQAKRTDALQSQAQMDRRTIALGDFRQAVDRAHSRLDQIVGRLASLETRLETMRQQHPPAADADLRSLEHQVENLRHEAQQVVHHLIEGEGSQPGLRAILSTFRSNNGHAQAQQFLQSQIDELSTMMATQMNNVTLSNVLTRLNAMPTRMLQHMGLTGQGGAQNPQQLIDQLNTEQGALLNDLGRDANIWRGISPGEVRVLAAINTSVDDFRTAYTSARTRMDHLRSEITGVRLENLSGPSASTIARLHEAQGWSPEAGGVDPFSTNQDIVGYYLQMGQETEAYEGGEPPLTSWATYAAHACNGAGEMISVMQTVRAAWATFTTVDGSLDNDRAAFHALEQVYDNPQMRAHLQNLFRANWSEVESAIQAVRHGSIESGMSQIRDVASRSLSTLTSTFRAFVRGNTEIATNILTARRIFMEAERAGHNGVEALNRAVASHQLQDPQHYLRDSFRISQQIKELGQQMSHLRENGQGGSQEYQNLAARRERLNNQRNLLIGFQEQAGFLQTRDTFGNADVAYLLEHTQGNLRLPGGAEFRPGAHWQDLMQRMGATVQTVRPPNDHRPLPTPPDDGAFYVNLTVQPNQVIWMPDPNNPGGSDRQTYPPGTRLQFRVDPSQAGNTATRFFLDGARAATEQTGVVTAASISGLGVPAAAPMMALAQSQALHTVTREINSQVLHEMPVIVAAPYQYHPSSSSIATVRDLVGLPCPTPAPDPIQHTGHPTESGGGTGTSSGSGATTLPDRPVDTTLGNSTPTTGAPQVITH